MPPLGRLLGFSLDCADVPPLAAFWSAVTGWEESFGSDDWVFLSPEGAFGLGIVKVDDHRPPTWPGGDVPKQAHLEVGVDDLDDAEAQLVQLGATRADHQPNPEKWRVLLDPAGHPFCITTGG